MNATLFASLISGGIGFLGVFVGSVIVPPIRERFSRRRDARYLAIRVICVLDGYIEDCASVALDSGDEDELGCSVAQEKAPPPPAYPTDINWKSIEHSLMYTLLALPAAAERAANYVAGAGENATAPDYSEYFEERSKQYSLLGLHAHDLTVDLRKRYQIPEIANREWEPVSHMREELRKIAERRKVRGLAWERMEQERMKQSGGVS